MHPSIGRRFGTTDFGIDWRLYRLSEVEETDCAICNMQTLVYRDAWLSTTKRVQMSIIKLQLILFERSTIYTKRRYNQTCTDLRCRQDISVTFRISLILWRSLYVRVICDLTASTPKNQSYLHQGRKERGWVSRSKPVDSLII